MKEFQGSSAHGFYLCSISFKSVLRHISLTNDLNWQKPELPQGHQLHNGTAFAAPLDSLIPEAELS